jgi:hypothetical protein
MLYSVPPMTISYNTQYDITNKVLTLIQSDADSSITTGIPHAALSQPYSLLSRPDIYWSDTYPLSFSVQECNIFI